MKYLKKILGVFVFVMVGVILLPNNVFATSIEEIKTSKELTLKSIPATSEDMLWILTESFSEEYQGYYFDDFSDDFTKGTLYYQGESTGIEVKFNYEYDKDIKQIVEQLVGNLSKESYELTDLEYLAWVRDTNEAFEKSILEPSMGDYSSDLKKDMQYKNFTIDVRLGDSFSFYTEKGGAALFKYDDTVYYMAPGPLAVFYKHIFYVDEDTTDVGKAIENRLKDNLGTGFSVEEGKTLQNELIDVFKSEYDPTNPWIAQQASSADEYATLQFNNTIVATDGPYHYLNDYLSNKVYYITCTTKSGETMTTESVIAVKDSSKIINPTFKSNDINSNIEVSTDGVIPLDTLIKVAKITSGEEYNKIVGLINNTNVEMFDLKLFSAGMNDYITKLDNGTFEVRIPVSNSLKGKDLIVYYVDNDNKVTEYKVTISGDYAVFNTNHFSIYTLAEIPSITNTEDNSNTANEANIEDNSTNTNTNTNNKTDTKNISNPQTGDNILFYIGVLGLSVIGLAGAGLYTKKRRFN